MADRMRAVRGTRFGGPEVLQLAEVDRPAPLPTEVLVRVEAAGVNPVDWKTRAGKGAAAQLAGPPPFVLGWDAVGVVEQLGLGVTRFEPGDRVYGLLWFPRPAGAYAEYVTAPSRQFALGPGQLSATDAAAVPLAGLTAWYALVETAGVQEGQSVLVHAAAGGVGHLAVQIAKACGAHVIGTARSARQGFLRDLGIDQAIDYTTTRFEDVLSGVDVVLDLIATDDYLNRSLQVLRPGGWYIGVPSMVNQELLQQGRDAGFHATGILVEPDGAALAELTALVNEGKVRPVVDEVFPLPDAAKAHVRGEQGHSQGKLVLSVS